MHRERPGRVVVGVDGSLSGLHALRRAVTEARARKLPLHAVRAWRPAPRGRYPTLEDQQEAESTTAALLVEQAFANTMGGPPKDLEVETVLVPDLPGPALLRHASRDQDLLVLGAGRRGFWRRMFGRGVARYCVARATCPVLVVPPPPLTRTASTRSLLRELRRDIDHLNSGR